MPVNLPLRPRHHSSIAHGHVRVAIVASEYNAEYVQALVDHASRELYTIQLGVLQELFSVPGAFEIPLAVKLAAEKKHYDAIIALGVILQGETAHAKLIAETVTVSLQRISLNTETPIIHEVLLLENEEQAQARCMGEELNRGIEAARAAVQMIKVVADIRHPHHHQPHK